jgi:hypothetical protein
VEAKPSKEQAVAEFLKSALALVTGGEGKGTLTCRECKQMLGSSAGILASTPNPNH